jgi:drug/metabolite transporter (DMT)-like permease
MAELGKAFRMTPERATALGMGAILLWATLASLTVLAGGLPPFQTTAVAFAIGGSVIALAAVLRGRAGSMLPTPVSLALGVYGLFGYHALYFAALQLAPPAEAHLLNSLWALFIVVFAALLPGHKLRFNHVIGALMGLSAAALLVWSRGGGTTGVSSTLGFALAIGCALVWSSYSVASRLLAAVPSESLAVMPGDGGAGFPLQPNIRGVAGARRPCRLACVAGARGRSRRRRLPAVGHRHEAG